MFSFLPIIRTLHLPCSGHHFIRLYRAFFLDIVSTLGLAGLLLLSINVSAQTANSSSKELQGKILVVGDSISAEYGLTRDSGWVKLLERKLAIEKQNFMVINASISGDTTSGGRSRLPALLKLHQPKVVIIELGGNDALRGLALKMTEENLIAMTRASKAIGAKVLIVPMQIPPNYGASYSKDFATLFGKVAKSEKVSLSPFILRGIADQKNSSDWFQSDRIHPAAKAQPIMLDNVWQALRPMLSAIKT